MSKQSNLKRRLEGLSEEEKINKIKDIALREQLDYWRVWGLRQYVEKKKQELGNFEPSSVV